MVYFALEESAEYFWTTILLDRFRERFGKALTYYQYKGYHKGMTKEDYQQIQEVIPEVEDMKKYVIVYDSVSNPTGLLKTVEKELEGLGRVVKGETIIDEFGNEITKKEFVYNDPDFHLVVVADHIGLLAPEKNEFAPVTNLHQAIGKWSEYVIKLICKRYNAVAVSVHQQAMNGENNDNFKLGRLEPSETKLGDNLLVGRDYMVTIGLFNPIKYGLNSYLDYNTRDFGDNFRTVHVIKHRNGIAGLAKAMWFDGVGNKFTELPKAKSQELINFLNSKH